jgi:hypothetical protein
VSNRGNREAVSGATGVTGMVAVPAGGDLSHR